MRILVLWAKNGLGHELLSKIIRSALIYTKYSRPRLVLRRENSSRHSGVRVLYRPYKINEKRARALFSNFVGDTGLEPVTFSV